MLLVLDETRTGAELAERRLACPSCPAGRLRPWATARPRVVELSGGRRVQLRLKRARCDACGRTHVLLPAWCAPHRAHAIEVIGTALAARLRGHSHRGIAADLGVAADTVRGWCRRIAAHAEHLRWQAMDHLAALDPEAVRTDPSRGPLADALDALAAAVAAAVAAARRRFDLGPAALWPLLGLLGLGEHLAPCRSG